MNESKTATSKEDPVLKELSETLRKELGDNLRSVILFGSRARGDFEEGSDYDIMVLVERKTRELENRIFDLKCEIDLKHNVLMSVVIEEQSHFDRRKYEPLFINIRREGVEV